CVRGPCCAPKQIGVVAPSARRRLTASAAQPLPQRSMEGSGPYGGTLPDARSRRKRAATFLVRFISEPGAFLGKKSGVTEVRGRPADASGTGPNDRSTALLSRPRRLRRAVPQDLVR